MGNIVCPEPETPDPVAEAHRMHRICELRERFLVSRRDEKVIEARGNRNDLIRLLPVIRQLQAQITKLALLKTHFEQVTTIKETHAVLTTVRDHLNQSEDTGAPNLDDVSDLQEALDASHAVFQDIDDVLKESWAGEEKLAEGVDPEAELARILGLPIPEKPQATSYPITPIQEEDLPDPPPSYPPSNSSSPFPEGPIQEASSPLSVSSQPVLEH